MQLYIYNLESISILKFGKLYLVWCNRLCHMKIKASVSKFLTLSPSSRSLAIQCLEGSAWDINCVYSEDFAMGSTLMMSINFQD